MTSSSYECAMKSIDVVTSLLDSVVGWRQLELINAR